MSNLSKKVSDSIRLIRKMESIALQYSEDGFYVAFSGGKDSQVLLRLVQEAGVKYKAHMQVTTLDPPELMKFVRRVYPDVERHYPTMNFFDLIVKKNVAFAPGEVLLCLFERASRWWHGDADRRACGGVVASVEKK